MIKLKKISAVALASLMAVSMVACSNGDTDSTQGSTDGNSVGTTEAPTQGTTRPESPEGVRDIIVGTWYDHYYTSDHDAVEDNPAYSPDPDEYAKCEMQIANMREIEEKYNVRLYFENLTWAGIQESISLSIMAGRPDCDIYLADLQFGIPAALGGYAQPISNFAAEGSDIYTDQTVMKYLHIDGSEDDYLFAPAGQQLDAYMLGFNMDMIEDAGLENPQDLYDKGEWTWDKFAEYLRELTVDEDNDGSTDIYGYGGFWTNFLNQMLLSNGATIAASPTSTLDSPEVLEVLEFINQIYNVDQSARPWNHTEWDVNNNMYVEGKNAFWIAAAWIMDAGKPEGGYNFEFGIVPFPTGPSGDQETNATYITAGNWYMIAQNVEDPETVYNVFYDWSNWYDFDLTLRDDNQWFVDSVTSPEADDPLRNFSYLEMCGKKEQLDIWGSLGVFSCTPMFPDPTNPDHVMMTPAQLIETNKEAVQTALDAFFKN